MKEITMYKTEDGKTFEYKKDALTHEKKMELKKILLDEWQHAEDFEDFISMILEDLRIFEKIYQAMKELNQ